MLGEKTEVTAVPKCRFYKGIYSLSILKSWFDGLKLLQFSQFFHQKFLPLLTIQILAIGLYCHPTQLSNSLGKKEKHRKHCQCHGSSFTNSKIICKFFYLWDWIEAWSTMGRNLTKVFYLLEEKVVNSFLFFVKTSEV